MFKAVKKVSVLLFAVALVALVAIVPATRISARAEEENIPQITVLAEQTEQSGQTEQSDQTEQGEQSAQDDAKGSKALSAAIAVGLAAALGALAMGIAIGKSNEAIARQPEAAGQIKSELMLGLVFIETAIIYALIVAILVIFVL